MPNLYTFYLFSSSHFLSNFVQGKLAKAHVGGFIVGFIDLDDPENNCRCERPFSAFHSILDGWNHVPLKEKCDLFNRN